MFPVNKIVQVNEFIQAAGLGFVNFGKTTVFGLSAELTGGTNWPVKEFKTFYIEAKTVIHAGEVAYSDKKIPVALAVNQTFKIEKLFKPNELGITHTVKTAAAPIIKSLGLRLKKRELIILPGSKESTTVYLAATAKNKKCKR